jgi:hypothetical protein
MNDIHRPRGAALVTGASRGLGAALGRELSRRGSPVVLVARDREALEETARAIAAEGGEAHALPADVGDKRAAYALAGAAAALVGPIEVLVHNASTLGPTPLPLLLDTECEDLELNTRMHEGAVPDADPTTLADPAQVATRIADMIRHADRIASGARIEASRWEAPS